MQQFVVAPNEASVEAPYIKRNIAMTRQAFDLTDVQGKKFPAAEDLTAADIVADRQTLTNVRLWDPKVVKQSYSQLQSLRTYYEFPDVDVDRYSIDGTRTQVLVAAREMNSAQLPSTSQTWVNRHLVYTHGFGLVMSGVNDSDSRGMPKFIIGDVPPAHHHGPQDRSAPHLLRRGDGRLRHRRHRHQGVRLPARRDERRVRVPRAPAGRRSADCPRASLGR